MPQPLPLLTTPAVASSYAAAAEPSARENVDDGTAAATVHVPAPQPDGLAGVGHSLTDRISPRVKGLVLLNILTFVYGSNISVVKETEAVLDPATFSAGRFVIATIAFSPFLLEALRHPKVRRAGFELGMWSGLGYLSQAVGLLSCGAGRASFISTFTVIVVPILAGLMGAKIPRVTWFSAAAAVAGVSLLETNGPHSIGGDVWTFLSAVLFGVHILRTEQFSKSLLGNAANSIALPLIALQAGRPYESLIFANGHYVHSVPPVQLFVIAFLSSSWALYAHVNSGDWSIFDLAAGGDWSSVLDIATAVPWAPMVYTGVVSTALCLWIEVVSMHNVSATEAAMVYTLEPLWGAAFAWTLLGERWGAKGWFGAALILGGSLAMQLLGRVPDTGEAPEVKAGSPEVLQAKVKDVAIAAESLDLAKVPEVILSEDYKPSATASDTQRSRQGLSTRHTKRD
eukprot:SM000084S23138  [mRNA]  locus=s84:355470:357948:- [translate_table: standard]